MAPLPGGGFRGDWSLGIVEGSVSEALGREVLEVLCRPREEEKRFVRGVGLPVRASYFHPEDDGPPDPNLAPFKAWPSSSVTLNQILRIHHRAMMRSNITRYRDWRRSLYALCETIAFAGKGASASIDEFIKLVPRAIRDREAAVKDLSDAPSDA